MEMEPPPPPPRTRSQQQKAITRKRKRNQEQEQVGIDNKKHSSGDGGVDKLPDDVLINILSRMSLKEAGRASVLAHRWRYLWRFAYGILRFDHREDSATRESVMKRKKFKSWVNTVLELHQGRCVEGLVISFQAKGVDQFRISDRTSRAIDSWVCYATRKEVQRFELNLSLDDRYKFPSVERLKSLSHGVSSCLCEYRLRTLRLAHVDIKDEVVHYFLASCPNLEELCIHFSYVTKNLQVIDPPSLRVLEISRCLKLQSLEISAVKLVSLTYKGKRNSLMFKKIPNIRELTISDDFCMSFVLEPKEHWSYSVQLEKLVLDFKLMDSVRLSVAPPDLPRLCSLKRLEVQVSIETGDHLLFFTSFIKASPQLREFRIELSYSSYSSYSRYSRYPSNPTRSKYRFPCTRVPSKALRFVRRKLKVVEIGGYIGCCGDEELVLALIKIGPSIERVVIDTKSEYYDEPELDARIAHRRRMQMDYTYMPDLGATTPNEAKERAKHLVSNFPRQIQAIVT